MKAALLSQLNEARAKKRPVVLTTLLQEGTQTLLRPDRLGDGAIAEVARKALRLDAACTVETADGLLFVQPFNPPLRLMIVGAVHIAQCLSTMAQLAGYAVKVVDPRGAFARASRFPGVDVSTDWPDEALQGALLDARTAVVTLTHDPKLDDPALDVALKSEAFYIGSLGSRRTHAARLQRLQELGHSAVACARIHGPVGLAIGAKSPAEIAVCILAEITQRLRQPQVPTP